MKLNQITYFDGSPFILAEELNEYRDAALAQAEYWAEGYCCRKVPVIDDKRRIYFYRLFVGPERKVKVRTLPGEEVIRKGTRGATVRKQVNSPAFQDLVAAR